MAGILSTGLTASLGIGEHVVQRLLPEMIDLLLPFADTSPGWNKKEVRTTPLPPMKDLVEQFHSRGDGMVSIGGHEYTVTHPLTKLDWTARTGLASCL